MFRFNYTLLKLKGAFEDWKVIILLKTHNALFQTISLHYVLEESFLNIQDGGCNKADSRWRTDIYEDMLSL